MRNSKDIWILVFVLIAFFVGLNYLAKPRRPVEDKTSSSYNADPMGTKAFYTLLGDRLGYNVRRHTQPFDNLPPDARVLVVVEPSSTGSTEDIQEELPALADWIRNGGTLVYASERALKGHGLHVGLPGAKGSPAISRLGKGRIYAFGSGDPVTNRGLRDSRSAVAIVDIISGHASKRDVILFDEYHHGHRGSRPLLELVSRPVKMSLVVFLVAGLLAAYSKGRRFGAVRSAPETDQRRPAGEYVAAVGRLYSRAGATDLAADIICDSLLRKLRIKLGMSEDSSRDTITSRVEALAGHDAAQTVGRILALHSRVLAGERPGKQELLSTTQEIQQLEKELGLERSNR